MLGLDFKNGHSVLKVDISVEKCRISFCKRGFWFTSVSKISSDAIQERERKLGQPRLRKAATSAVAIVVTWRSWIMEGFKFVSSLEALRSVSKYVSRCANWDNNWSCPDIEAMNDFTEGSLGALASTQRVRLSEARVGMASSQSSIARTCDKIKPLHA